MKYNNYFPKELNKKDRKTQKSEIKKSKKLYKKGKYHTRKKLSSFKSKKSGHVENATKIYNVESIKADNKLAKATKCKKSALTKIIKKGMGAYYSSGSRPNQTPHSWGRARLASAITGGPSSKIDIKILIENCKKNSKALKLAKKYIEENKKASEAKKNKKASNALLEGGNKKITRRRGRDKVINFSDYPDFKPNLTPKEIFQLGSFGGTYWRPIYSSVTKQNYENLHLNYPISWWKGLTDKDLTSSKYDVNINKYKVKVGTSLKFWQDSNWITKYNPYGWMHWYCDFYRGKRSPDDKRQISRWKKLAGPNGRFFRFLVTLILKKDGKWDDFTISPKIRQTLQHWAYQLNKKDFDNEIKRRKK